MLVSKGQVNLQVMTTCLIDCQKMFIFVEGKGTLMFFYHRKKEKCERSQLRSMDWCGEKPFGHQDDHTIYL